MPDFKAAVPAPTVPPLYLEAVHPRHRRTLARSAQERLDESPLALEFNLHLSAGQIPGESHQSQAGGLTIDEVAESDSLDGAAN